ncbi:MAG: hypothetical protein GX986_06245 [Firmicutes bacterium]|nr:hypothetical protein [Bacillota bacterium]
MGKCSRITFLAGGRAMRRTLIGLHTFVGIGALAGGAAALLNPYEPLGVPVDALEFSPFDNYLIPGIILFTVIGLGSISSALLLYSGSRFRGCVSATFSWALVIWIVVQCLMLRTIHFLHITFLAIGVTEVILSTATMLRHELFPLNVIMRIFREKHLYR